MSGWDFLNSHSFQQCFLCQWVIKRSMLFHCKSFSVDKTTVMYLREVDFCTKILVWHIHPSRGDNLDYFSCMYSSKWHFESFLNSCLNNWGQYESYHEVLTSVLFITLTFEISLLLTKVSGSNRFNLFLLKSFLVQFHGARESFSLLSTATSGGFPILNRVICRLIQTD